MNKLIWMIATIVLALSLGEVAQAAEPSTASPAPAPAAEPAVDEEEQVDEGLKRFGYLTGLARGCVAEAQRAALEREALDLHAVIARLLGTDRAFLFSSSFGYGTTVEVETPDCAEVLQAYERRVETYRSSVGRAK